MRYQSFGEPPDQVHPFLRLTSTEILIIDLYADGYNYKDIGAILRSHPDNIKTYVQRIAGKLSMRKIDLVRFWPYPLFQIGLRALGYIT